MTLTLWSITARTRLQLLTICYCTQKGFLSLSNHSKHSILLEKKVYVYDLCSVVKSLGKSH